MQPHLSEQQLLRYLDGELSRRAANSVKAHLESCWSCRSLRANLEETIHQVVHLHQSESLPAIDGPRALLQARLAQQPASLPRYWTALLACAVLALLTLLLPWRLRTQPAVVFTPDSRLTPGATLVEDRRAVCSQPDMKNKAVPAFLQRRVFAEYGISGADPHGYELDYLVTPALGGADDIHNLWPHSYARTAWNARVKDALEDRLRNMVCTGSLDLNTAQRDIATNWIAAYKKYFQTERPLATPPL